MLNYRKQRLVWGSYGMGVWLARQITGEGHDDHRGKNTRPAPPHIEHLLPQVKSHFTMDETICRW